MPGNTTALFSLLIRQWLHSEDIYSWLQVYREIRIARTVSKYNLFQISIFNGIKIDKVQLNYKNINKTATFGTTTKNSTRELILTEIYSVPHKLSSQHLVIPHYLCISLPYLKNNTTITSNQYWNGKHF